MECLKLFNDGTKKVLFFFSDCKQTIKKDQFAWSMFSENDTPLTSVAPTTSARLHKK